MNFAFFDAFREEKIEYFGILPMEKLEIINASLFSRRKIEENTLRSAIIFAIPYYTEITKKNISAYAVARDYHHYISLLEKTLGEKLKSAYPNDSFYFFSDNSPINERKAAVDCGIGFLGKNGLVINEKYSSFFFIGEILSTAVLDEKIHFTSGKIPCDTCDICIKACPKEKIGECLSALTQKKGELNKNEENIIKKYGMAWGCDICQNACPITAEKIRSGEIYSKIPFFNEEKIPLLTAEIIEKMPEDEFSLRAYSWRKRQTILRNLKILEESER